jgi:hypothetical protein
MTIKLTPEQRERVIAELQSRTKPVAEMTDEEIMGMIQRGQGLMIECDPEYAAKYAPKERKKKGAA